MITSAGFATNAIHGSYDPAQERGALCPPVHLTSTFAAPTADDMAARFTGESSDHFYSRISNPTVDLLERRMATLEGGEAALGTASGMGAITAVMWTLLSPGDELLVDRTLYGCTFAFFRHGLARFGVTITSVDMTQPELVAQAISAKTKAIYFETPANPNMRLIDISAISAIARNHGAATIVDNTYSTPFLTRPLSLGADLVVHSATKYLGGHGDLVAGLVVGSADMLQQIRLVGLKDMTGAVMSPFTAMLVLRGIKTLNLRMERHCRNGTAVARFLSDHPKIAAISYPGLASHPQHELAKEQMSDMGGMIAFELKGGIAAGKVLIDGLDMIHCAVSLGDAETLIQHPASMTHSTYTPEERATYGISDGLIRLSVGLEDEADILADLDQALA